MGQAESLKTLLKENGFAEPETVTDAGGIERVVAAKKPLNRNKNDCRK